MEELKEEEEEPQERTLIEVDLPPVGASDSAYETDLACATPEDSSPRKTDDVVLDDQEESDETEDSDEDDDGAETKEEAEVAVEESENQEEEREESEAEKIPTDITDDNEPSERSESGVDFDENTSSQLTDEQKSKKFVLFFLTPSKQVVSVRNISNGTLISNIKSKLETLAGIPGDMYELKNSKYVYKDNTPLVLGRNVTMGAVIRINLLAKWKMIYLAVERQDIDLICKDGGVALFGAGIYGHTEDEIEEEFRRRLFRALYLSAFKNERKLCEVLVELGADVNHTTDHGNTVLHVCASQNHMPLIDVFLKKGAELMIHNSDSKTPINIAQEIGSSSSERYMRLYNWTLTGKRHFPDVERMEKSGEERELGYRTGQFSDLTNRCKSAPSRKTLPNSANERSRSQSKFHSDCNRNVDFVALHNVPAEMQYTTTIDYVREEVGQSTVDKVQRGTKSAQSDRRTVPYIDFAKSEENRTIIDVRRPRAKSAIVRAKHTPVYYNWYKDREPNVMPRRVRAKSAKSTSDDLDELRRLKNEAAFKTWLLRKERNGSFDPHSDEDEAEPMKQRFYSEEENERAFKEWLDGKKDLLEQMARKGSGKSEPFRTKRERIQAVVDIGDNEPLEKRADPSMYHTAYQRWMRQRQGDQLSDHSRYMSVDDLKRLVEAKRKKTVLNAKAYEEWLEEKREENSLRRRVRTRKTTTSPRPETFQKWIGMTTTGETKPDPYKSCLRATSSKYERNSARSSRITSSIPSVLRSTAKSGETTQLTKQEKADIFEGFLFENAWRNIQKTVPFEEDKSLRAVRFKPR